MIDLQFHQLARQVHQERIAHALKPRPEWPSPRLARRTGRPWSSFVAWFRRALLARRARQPTLRALSQRPG